MSEPQKRNAFLLVASSSRPDPWSDLRNLPETTPGTQVVHVGSSNNSDAIASGPYLVLDCEFFIGIEHDGNSDPLERLRLVPYPTYEAFVQSYNVRHTSSVGRVTPVPTSPNAPAPVLAPSTTRPTTPLLLPRATLITATKSAASERFWRVSAYANDRRITSDRELVAHTFVTTDSDIEFIASGLGAVGRHALPNPFPSIYAFSIVPTPGTDICLGTVRPQYNQAGGGVEGVFFNNTGTWTVSNHAKVLPAW